MTDPTYQDLLSINELNPLATRMVNDYLLNNAALFEKDEVHRRTRILEAFISDESREIVNISADKPKLDTVIEHATAFLKKLFPDEEFVIEAIASENESDAEMPIYKIRSYPSDPTLEVIKTKWDRHDYIIPEFQRGWVWNPTQASRLVESFLAGLPVPPIFVYRESISGKEIVIDGQQRLRTIVGFQEGRLPDGSPFKLRGVNARWEGKFYSTLDKGDLSSLRSSVLRVMVVEQIDPGDVSSIYEIFARLNTGGTALSAQEVRNASYHGPFNDLIKQLNLDPTWREIFGRKQPDPRMRDVELILRFLALTEQEYTKPMKVFINLFMGKHKHDSDSKKWTDLFKTTVDRVYKSLGAKPFNISRGINSAVFDSVMVAFAKCPNAPKDIQEKYHQLVSSPEYRQLVYVSTTDADTVKRRIELAQRVLFEKCQK